MHPRTTLLLLAALAVPLCSVRAGGVRIVEATGTQNFATIQAAVNAAPEGAVLLVGQGSYAGFTVSGKSVSILAVPNAVVSIQGKVSVSGIASNQSVVLSGLDVSPPRPMSPFAPGIVALDLSNSTGHLRFQDCSFRGDDFGGVLCEDSPARDGPPGVRVTDCTRAGFTACTLRGGKGEDSDEESITCVYYGGGDGAPGLRATNSTTVLYDCGLVGGPGGFSVASPGTGGAGANLASTSAFASGCSFSGGEGGWYMHKTCHAPGGTGCLVSNGSLLDEIGGTFQGGSGGCSEIAPGTTGPVHSMPGPARVATLSQKVQADASAWSVSYQGAAADRPFLFSSFTPSALIWLPFHGAWLVRRTALLPPVVLGTPDSSGDLVASVPTPDLPAGSLVERRFGQVVTRSQVAEAGLVARPRVPQQPVYLGSGAVLFLLDRQSGPDCNGNGVSDLVDVIDGASADANHNLIPDGCPGG